MWSTLINKDMMGCFTCHTHQWHLAQLSLHHPFEIPTQETIDNKDVEGTLMIADKDIRLFVFQVLTAFYFDGKQQYMNNQTCP
jgi:hypothetical protein